MLVAVVLVAMTRDARMGITAPAWTPVNVIVCPPAIITARLPAPPTKIDLEVYVRSVLSFGVTATAFDAGSTTLLDRFERSVAISGYPLL
jgi:hypothetical protein